MTDETVCHWWCSGMLDVQAKVPQFRPTGWSLVTNKAIRHLQAPQPLPFAVRPSLGHGCS